MKKWLKLVLTLEIVYVKVYFVRCKEYYGETKGFFKFSCSEKIFAVIKTCFDRNFCPRINFLFLSGIRCSFIIVSLMKLLDNFINIFNEQKLKVNWGYVNQGVKNLDSQKFLPKWILV